MGIFQSTNTAVFVDSTGLLFCFRKANDRKELKFTGIEMKNMEVIDQGKIITEITGFVKTNKISLKTCLIILKNQFLFQKCFRLDAGLPENKAVNTFLEEIPFEKEKLAVKYFHNHKYLIILATNKIIFETVAEGLRQAGGQVAGILPETVFKNLSENNWKLVDRHPIITSEADLLKL